MQTLKIAGGVLIAAISMGAQAQLSTERELRGYSNCVDAASEQVQGFATTPGYFINRTDDANRYYINGTAWQNGERVAVRVSCDTSRSGRSLETVDVNGGRYVLDNSSLNSRVAAN